MAQDDLVPCSGFGGFGRPWRIGGEKGERWLLLSTTTTSSQTLEKQWQQNWRQTHVIAMSSPVTIHRQVCVCGGDILAVFCVWGTFWVYSHQFPFSDHLIHTPFAFYWLDIDNALVLICFQLNMYVCMCHKNVSWDCWVFLWFWCVFLWYWWVFLWFGVNKCKTEQCAPIDYVSLSPGLLLVRRSVGSGRNDLESAVKEINTLQTLSSSPWLQG